MKTNAITITSGLDPAQYVDISMSDKMDMTACLSMLETMFHPDGLRCPQCRSLSRIGNGKTAKGVPRYRCTECGQTYTIISHTPFSGTKLGPRKIVLFMWMFGIECEVRDIARAVALHPSTVSRIILKIKTYGGYLSSAE